MSHLQENTIQITKTTVALGQHIEINNKCYTLKYYIYICLHIKPICKKAVKIWKWFTETFGSLHNNQYPPCLGEKRKPCTDNCGKIPAF